MLVMVSEDDDLEVMLLVERFWYGLFANGAMIVARLKELLSRDCLETLKRGANLIEETYGLSVSF